MNTTAPVRKGGQSNVAALQDVTAKKPHRTDKPQNSNKFEGYKGGRRDESREVQISKACSYILRHGAAKESLVMRSDGYVRVDDLLARPKLRNLQCDFKDLQEIVANNAKQRFSLLLEPTSSESLGPAITENPGGSSSPSGVWWIRANQGHTLEVEDLAMVEITQVSDIPMAVHGTTMKAWALIKDTGLSRMQRNHIHLAKGLSGDGSVISGMRASSTVLIYIDVARALASGIKFYVSANGVVLSPGDSRGFIPHTLFEKVLGKFGNSLKRWNGTAWVADSGESSGGHDLGQVTMLLKVGADGGIRMTGQHVERPTAFAAVCEVSDAERGVRDTAFGSPPRAALPPSPEDWAYKAEIPMLPVKYRNSFWAPALAKHRKEYLRIMAPITLLIIVLMWIVFPVYWGSLGEPLSHVPNLTGYLVNYDGDGALGQTMTQAFENNTAGIGVAKNAHLTWYIVDPSTMPTENDVIQHVLEENVWTAVVIHPAATQTLINARINGDNTYNGSLAITHYYSQGRNENAANTYIVPYTAALLQKSLAIFNARFTGEYLSSIGTDVTAIAAIARAPVTVSQPFSFIAYNLRPFTKPVSTALLLVGNIYITIFAFIVTMAHDGARRVIHPYLRYRSYIALRIITPMIIYIPVSFSYAMVSLPFHATFGDKYGYAGGFFLFWIFVWMGMASLGLALEAMITILTPRFTPFFLLILVIFNVSVGTLPFELQPGFYKWGYGFPIYNLSLATRTILFDTKNHLARNAGVILGWIALSMLTIPLFTWLTRREETDTSPAPRTIHATKEDTVRHATKMKDITIVIRTVAEATGIEEGGMIITDEMTGGILAVDDGTMMIGTDDPRGGTTMIGEEAVGGTNIVVEVDVVVDREANTMTEKEDGVGRKASGWDVKPPGYEHLSAQQAKQTGLFNLPGANRSQPAPAVIGVPPVQFPSFGSFPPPGAPGVTGAPNLARQSRRLYVGNITYEANEENLHTFFSEKMTEMGFSTSGPGDPVLAVQVNHEKSYAFVEFRNAEDATAAMAFDGIIFQSGPLKIRRPKDYAGSDAAPSGVHVPGVVSTIVPDSVNKIFVGGLPTYLNDEQVMELLKSFGELKAFNLVKDSSTGLSKGFAFFEYVDPNVTDLATQGLNGMELGDRYLVVQRASIGAKGISSTPGMPSAEEYSAAMGVGMGMGGMARPIIPAQVDLAKSAESRILLMLNMVTPEDLVDDAEYNEILDDIRAECANFGQVEDIKIPRPPKKEKTGWQPGGAKDKNEMQAEGVGRVYVKYHQPAGAQMGLKALAGRSFAGRSIIATLLGDEANSVFEPSQLAPVETAEYSDI
ncbi:hypothetical protein FRB98_009463 [Tulasnella sp. 332]|nr:hypothetical protein FRB98_009463 [Tulasnella sp. 332]